jgi:two-component system invasion response regulator UvrY
MTRVLIVDDHPIVREGVKQIISGARGIKIVDEAADGRGLIGRVRKRKPDFDVLVLDISLPGKSGLDLLKQIREVKPELPVLMLSIHPEDQYAVRSLKAGASGYLTKDAVPGKLVDAIRTVAKGERYVSESLAQRLAAEIANHEKKPPHERLSDREYEIFRMIAAGKSGNEIGRALHLSPKTVSTYRTRIFQKTKLKNNAELARYAIANGLLD